ncbi:hypothetical protein RhiXN_11567 [Rhizoctonia solani]|uniref:RNase H type-1 domain-containing protein n=1 Tax=Rhizoctonia solani TaxID=456999 RepID=A0A8H8P3Q6_9AGAM|nr:uncharacterized protein RhiXN_11567 [Rhizoctonia solani]QRW24655.1 hypothetical protein RhiXN_11567 [Rhizoctonia solani]
MQEKGMVTWWPMACHVDRRQGIRADTQNDPSTSPGPGHNGVEGNETADRLANEGARAPQTPYSIAPYMGERTGNSQNHTFMEESMVRTLGITQLEILHTPPTRTQTTPYSTQASWAGTSSAASYNTSPDTGITASTMHNSTTT